MTKGQLLRVANSHAILTHRTEADMPCYNNSTGLRPEVYNLNPLERACTHTHSTHLTDSVYFGHHFSLMILFDTFPPRKKKESLTIIIILNTMIGHF